VTDQPKREPALLSYDAAKKAINKLALGQRIDRACKQVHTRFDKVQFRKHADLFDAYRQARDDYLRNELDDLIALADESDGMDRDELAALKLRIDTRKWFAERLLDDYQPKMKAEHQGVLSLVVETNVPRPRLEAIRDAEARDITNTQAIEDLMQ
jgi:primosomal protein N''